MNPLFWLLRLSGAAMLLAWAGAASAAERFDRVFINEILADNRQGLRDADGDRSGWIELCNGDFATVNLEGWFLTDTPTNLTRWRFPAVGVAPDKCLLVFASGKDRADSFAALHTDFRLDPRGGYLVLVNRATNVVAEFTYAAQRPDVSEGRTRGEPALRGAFARPTPGKHNAISGDGFAPAVRFSRPDGNFTEPFTLELSAPGNEVAIRYTLDGTLPNRESPSYEAPLRVTNSLHLRARAYQAGKLPGPPASAAFAQLASSALAFTSTLPVLIMNTFGRQIATGSRSTEARLSLHEPAADGAALSRAPTLTARGASRARGSSSAGMPQTSFALDFIDEFGDDEKRAWLGLPPESEWVLYAPNQFDPVMIHNPFVHQLSRDMGRYSPRTRFVEVFLVRTGGPIEARHYHGVYVLLEKIKIGPERVNIDRLGEDDLEPPALTGGYLMKFDRLGPGEQGFHFAGRQAVYVEPKERTLLLPQRAPQRRFLEEYFEAFERALDGPDWRDREKGYPAYLDVNAAIDFHVLQVLSGNVDYMSFSTFFHLPREGRITLGPHWDFDRALGSTDGRDANPRRWNTGRFFDGAWMSRIFQDVDFWQLWVDRWQALRRAEFSRRHIDGLIDRLTGELLEAQPRQEERWDLMPRGGSYEAEIAHMKDWLAERVDFIDGQLTQPPVLGHEGGLVPAGFRLTLTVEGGATIYYTLDGSDPRLPQGGISPAAIPYDGPILLETSARVAARAHDRTQRQRGGPPGSTPWSSLVRAKFVVTP